MPRLVVDIRYATVARKIRATARSLLRLMRDRWSVKSVKEFQRRVRVRRTVRSRLGGLFFSNIL